MQTKFTCPRRPASPVFNASEQDADWWNSMDGTCTYCGSMNPEAFMARLEAGDVELGATDKDYKVYVTNAGGAQFKQTYRDDQADTFHGHEDPRHHWITRDVQQTQFYFYHLSREQMIRVVEIYNAKRIKFGGGIAFYVLPFFIGRGQ